MFCLFRFEMVITMQKLKILVVDDEVVVRSFIKSVIEKENLPIKLLLQADNGRDAISITAQYKPDLVFMDIRIPEIDGIHAAKKILEDYPQTQIIIVSAYDDFDYARTAFLAGVCDYLLKPVKPVDIVNAIRKISTYMENHAAENGPILHKSELVRKIDDYVRENLDKPIHLDDLANTVFLSPSHLSRTFKQLTGISIVDFIQEQKLNAAAKLLISSERTITEIAGLVGFNDGTYFATCFKNKMGLSPKQYRKTHNI